MMNSEYEQLDFLSEATQCYRLGKYTEAIRILESASAGALELSPAGLLVVRCLIAQGRFAEASKVCRALLDNPQVERTTEWRLARLRLAWLRLFLEGDLDAVVLESEAIFNSPESDARDPWLIALTKFLYSVSLATAVEWRLRGPSEIGRARSLMAESARIYRDLGEEEEALEADLKLGQLYLMGGEPDRESARAIFEEAYFRSESSGSQVRLAQARLRLAELDFDEQFAQPAPDAESRVDLTGFEKALELYQSSGHALGAADVYGSVGNRVNKIGGNSCDLFTQALSLYQQQHYLIGIYSISSSLGLWYTQLGELGQALSAHREAIRVSQEMGFIAAEASSRMGLGDYYLRTGEFARALSEYEMMERLAGSPAMRALRKVSLAILYAQMNLHDRAIESAREAIKSSQEADLPDTLSQAYLILGNALQGSGKWGAAIVAWRNGADVDEMRRDRPSQAEKLQCCAQATVMKHYGRGRTIPQKAYEEATALYERSRDLLSGDRDPRSLSIIASNHQMQGQTALTSGRTQDGVESLTAAREVYAGLGLRMQTATTDAMLGLAYMDAGKRFSPDFYAEAEAHHLRALDYFKQVGSREQSWNLRYLLADTLYRRGLFAADVEMQTIHWRAASDHITDAASDIDWIRGSYVDPDPMNDLAARMGLVSNKEKVYIFGIQLHSFALKDPGAGLDWVERLKGRAFLDVLALTPLASPPSINRGLIDREKQLLDDLSQASTQAAALALNETLHLVWNEMAKDPLAFEYLVMRRGEPLSWKELSDLLRPPVS